MYGALERSNRVDSLYAGNYALVFGDNSSTIHHAKKFFIEYLAMEAFGQLLARVEAERGRSVLTGAAGALLSNAGN